MIRRLTLPALVLVTAVGCSGAPPVEPVPTSTSHEHGGDEHTLVPVPSTTPDQAAVAARAVEALTAYGRRDLPYDQWFAQLLPFLDETAVDVYATVSPSRIPAFTIDAPGETAAVTGTHAVVDVATSIGRYTLELRRAEISAEWSVTRIQPPN